MKKKFFAIVALFTCITLGMNAQVYVGGSLGFTSSKMSNGGHDQDGSSFKILPEIGYQLDPSLSIGLQVGYSHGYAAFGSLNVTDFKAIMNTAISTATDISEDDTKLNSFTFAPYVRYNVLNFGKVNFFVEGSVGYTNIKTEGNRDYKVDALEIAIRPGVSFQLSDRINALAKLGSLGYMEAKEKESDQKITRFGLDADTYNLLLGINFLF